MDRFVVRCAAEAAEVVTAAEEADVDAEVEAETVIAAVEQGVQEVEQTDQVAISSGVEEAVAEAWEAAGAAEARTGGRAILMEPWDEWEGEDGTCWGSEEGGWEEWGEEAEAAEREAVEPPPKKPRLLGELGPS